MNWSLAAILTATTERRFVEDWLEFHALACYMTGESVATHQMDRVFNDHITPAILMQHPDLASVDCAAVTPANAREFLAEQVQRFGLMLWLDPLGCYDHRDPIEEAEAILGDDAGEKLVLFVPGWPTKEATHATNTTP